MAKDENTAVNDLIARVHGSPASPPGPSMFTTAPAKMPVAAPFEPPRAAVPRAPIVPPPLDPNMPGGPGSGPARFPPPGAPAVLTPPWAATVPLNAPRERPRSGEHLLGTMRLKRRSEGQVMFSKLVLPMALLIVVGMLAGGWVAMRGERTHPRRPAPAEPAAMAPAPVVAPVPAPTVTPAVNLVDVRVDSIPTGATVTLIDGGRHQPVGNTPISVSLDPSREYDLMFSSPNKQNRIEHVNVANTHRVSVTLP